MTIFKSEDILKIKKFKIKLGETADMSTIEDEDGNRLAFIQKLSIIADAETLRVSLRIEGTKLDKIDKNGIGHPLVDGDNWATEVYDFAITNGEFELEVARPMLETIMHPLKSNGYSIVENFQTNITKFFLHDVEISRAEYEKHNGQYVSDLISRTNPETI